MTNAVSLRDDAMRAFISSLSQLQASAPTWCSRWSAHDLTAHVTAAAEERADLIDDHLAGKPSRATRSWEVREPPFRAMPDAVLRERLVEHAVRFETNVSALREDDAILYTGGAMTAQRLRMHSHSEAVLHRWDLVGDEPSASNCSPIRQWLRTHLLCSTRCLLWWNRNGGIDLTWCPGG
jgi:uncharacterized protein (TIGR03083 family)